MSRDLDFELWERYAKWADAVRKDKEMAAQYRIRAVEMHNQACAENASYYAANPRAQHPQSQSQLYSRPSTLSLI